tara:strand:+ start:2594 stop:3511 length:918 start_codon:yes stop_codon:yes gene_type:complete
MIDTLVLAGGGLKGFCIIESINLLIINKIISLKQIKNYYATSVGTIISLLLVIGYNMDELHFFINNFNFNKLSDDVDVGDLFEYFGLSTGKSIMSVIQSLLYEKINQYDITFEKLYQRFNKKINIITTNITTRSEEVFSFENTPSVSVLIAIRMSIAVPIIFTPVCYNGCQYLDGGLVNNFPINHVKSTNYLGITCNFKIKQKLEKFHQYIFNFINIAVKTITFKNITKENLDRIIFLENENNDISELDFNIDNVNKLKKIGINSTLNYLKKNNNLIKKIKFNNFLIKNIEFIYESFFPFSILHI